MPILSEIRSIEYPEIQDLGEPFDEEVPDGEPADGLGEERVDSPAAETPEAPAAREEEPDAETEPESGTDPPFDKAAAYDRLNEEWATNKAGFVSKFLAGLSDAEKAALLQQSAPQPEAPAWEPQSDGEQWLQKHTKTIEAIPQMAEQFDRELKFRDNYLNDALISNAALEAKLDAVLSILDVTLPAHDAAAIAKALSNGKTSYRDAIKQNYRPALEKAVAAKKQAVKPRPRTPSDQGSEMPQIKAGMSMSEIYSKF